MYVTAHAINRIYDRINARDGERLVGALERTTGEQGTVAYLLGRMPGKAHTADGSNGDVIVAVAIDGSVETVYYRRSTQDMSAGFFGARSVIDIGGAV